MSGVAGERPAAARTSTLERRKGFFRGSFQAMGGPCEFLTDETDEAAASALLDLISAEAWRIEDKFSRYLPGNVVDRINSSNGNAVEVDDETANLLDFAASLHDLAEGRFDITSGVLRRAWTFDGGDRMPDKSTVEEILDRVGWRKVQWSRPVLRLEREMQIDFGGIGKEYAVDKAAAELAAQTGSACLVNFGGDIFANRPPAGSAGWQVGIDAFGERDAGPERTVRLRNGALATSGDARRFVMYNGVRYGHILDPTTGWPVTDAPRSVTVAADTCTEAGMLATLAMLRGRDAESFLERQNVKHWCFR